MTHEQRDINDGATKENIYENNRGYVVGRAGDFSEITGGYFMGAFMEGKGYPELNSSEVEVAVIALPLKDNSPPHFHKKMTEITYVVKGTLHLIVDGNDIDLKQGEFLVVHPGSVLQNPSNEPETKVFVIKIPSIPGDKFYAGE